MLKDQIVGAIRRIRDARAKQFSYDLGAICREAKEREQAEKRKLLLPPKKGKATAA